MLKVLPIQTKEEQEEVCKICGAPFRVEALAYKALSEEVLCGVCQFRMDDKGGHILDFCWPEGKYEFEPLFVLGRGTLNFIDLCGVHFATFDGEIKKETLIKAIGFNKDKDGKWSVDLTDFFKEPCKHGHGMDEIAEKS